MRRFFINKIENMRDIGGYAIDDKNVVKEGKIIRTNVITNLDNEDLEKIKNMGFSTIIDLRNDEEIKKRNGVFFKNPQFFYNHIPINGGGRIPENEESIIDTYIEMLYGKEQIKEIFEILSEANSGVIYYCNAGKDRTGVVTALILKLLGVNERDIAVDYVASGVFLEKMLEEYAKEINNKEVLKIITPKHNTILKLLRYIQENYNSIEQYLKSCGLTDEKIKKIKEKYIQEI